MIGLKKGTVKLLPHNKDWSKLFEKEKDFLLEMLGDNILDIQHIGSTSIPGIPAKPIIDISVGIDSMRNSQKIIKLFENLGYEYRPDFGGQNIHLLFAKGPEENRTHFIHVMKYKGQIWNNDLAFRNYLREHAKVAQEYAQLKRGLAKKYSNDRVNYTKSKSVFIQGVINLASNS